MAFQLREFIRPDFSQERFQEAPNAKLGEVLKDGVAPAGYHAMSIFPEYFKVEGEWLLAEESRMDCVAVLGSGGIEIREFRRLRKGEQVFLGRTEDGSEGVLVHSRAFHNGKGQDREIFAFRQNRSRETAFSRDYDELYEILKHDREYGKIVWVMGPAFAFDHDAREAFSKMIANGYADAVLAGNALATHDLEAGFLNTALGQNIYTQEIRPNGHYNHLDTINRVRACGSIPAFLE